MSALEALDLAGKGLNAFSVLLEKTSQNYLGKVAMRHYIELINMGSDHVVKIPNVLGNHANI
jgi:hypothetical protein